MQSAGSPAAPAAASAGARTTAICGMTAQKRAGENRAELVPHATAAAAGRRQEEFYLQQRGSAGGQREMGRVWVFSILTVNVWHLFQHWRSWNKSVDCGPIACSPVLKMLLYFAVCGIEHDCRHNTLSPFEKCCLILPFALATCGMPDQKCAGENRAE